MLQRPRMCLVLGPGISRVDKESTGARPMNRIRARAENIFDSNTAYNQDPAARKVFNPNEYNPLRNPGHFSDSKHLANRGLMPENSLPQIDGRSSSQQQKPRDSYNRETRVDVNSRQYKDSLEQYVDQQIDSRNSAVNRSVSGNIAGQINNQLSANFRSSLPAMKMKPTDAMSDLEFKGNYANFYGTEDQSTRKYIYDKVQPDVLRQSADQVNGRRAMMAARQKNKVDEQTQFMTQALSSNILLKRDAEKFFSGGEAQDSASGFVRNYNEFYRG
jgi:hypothetical protein